MEHTVTDSSRQIAFIHEHKIAPERGGSQAILRHISYELCPQESLRDLVIWSDEYHSILDQLGSSKIDLLDSNCEHISTTEFNLGKCQNGSISILHEMLLNDPIWSVDFSD